MNVVKCALHFTENVRQHFTYPSKTSPSPSASSTSRYMTECCSPEKRAHVIVLTESKVPNNHHQSYGVLGTFPNPRPLPGRGFFVPRRESEYTLRVSSRLFFPLFGPIPASGLPCRFLFFPLFGPIPASGLPCRFLFFLPFPNLTTGDAPREAICWHFPRKRAPRNRK